MSFSDKYLFIVRRRCCRTFGVVQNLKSLKICVFENIFMKNNLTRKADTCLEASSGDVNSNASSGSVNSNVCSNHEPRE